ncbi:MAG: hypothetical protein MUF10_18565 [Thermoanaerobaculaceae bacterium]|nr:hypothetical protein [Thermoanaerobaculaceae bacterium]
MILAETVARRRGVTYPEALSSAADRPPALRAAATTTSTGRLPSARNAPTATTARGRTTQGQRRRRDPLSLRLLSSIRKAPRSGRPPLPSTAIPSSVPPDNPLAVVYVPPAG